MGERDDQRWTGKKGKLEEGQEKGSVRERRKEHELEKNR